MVAFCKIVTLMVAICKIETIFVAFCKIAFKNGSIMKLSEIFISTHENQIFSSLKICRVFKIQYCH